MIDEELLLRERFSELLRWERTKRREKFIVAGFSCSVLISLMVLPAKGLLPPWASPFYSPPLFFLILVSGLFLLRPWRSRESLRTVMLLDKALHMEERALTAWEILSRKEIKAVELLVLKEAGERLRGVDPRLLFKRRYSWYALFAPPLLFLWLLLVWLDIGVHFDKGVKASEAISVAQKLKAFSLDLQEKAKAQGLTESLKIAHALEELAEKNLRGEVSERKLGEDLAGLADKIEEVRPVTGDESEVIFPAAARDGLLDLKAELETLRSSLLPEFGRREERLGPEARGRIGALPRLREEIERGRLSIENLRAEELNRFLEKLEKGVTAELDRRTLLEIKDFLDLLIQGGEGRETQEALRERSQAEQGSLSQAERVRGKGGLPGDQPGTKGQLSQTPPPFKASAATHLKGLLGEGKSGSLTLRGESPGRGSKTSQEEILTSYRRQAEEEVASERIPEALKETIRSYFLSLGMSEGKGGK